MGKNEKGEITVNVNEYREFVKAKIKMAELNGVPCEKSEINPILFPHQRDIVQWAVQGGQRAIFAAFGLGKTMMQIEIARILLGRNGGASELCESYFDDGVKYLRMAEADRNVPSLFDELDKESRAV